jgi:hypothetical protein
MSTAIYAVTLGVTVTVIVAVVASEDTNHVYRLPTVVLDPKICVYVLVPPSLIVSVVLAVPLVAETNN